MKKMLVFTLAAALVLTLAACGEKAPASEPSGPSPVPESLQVSEQESNQIPDPFSECESLEEAKALAGFEFAVFEAPEECDRRVIRVLKGQQMTEVIDYDGEDEIFRIRKAKGSDEISGDYTPYETENRAEVGEISVTMKGSGELIYVAVWTQGDYTYSVSSESGVSQETMRELVQSVK